MDFSCIYVNFNSITWLERSLESLFRFEKDVTYEVIVINNDLREQGALETLATRFPIRVIPNETNEGFGRAVNRAAANAKGEVLFLVNPDTQWQRPILAQAKLWFQEHPQTGALGATLCDEAGAIPNGGKFLTCTQLFLNHLPFLRSGRVEWISGAALFVPRAIFQDLGGFDERFFLYFEDMDLCKRIAERGFLVSVTADISLTHHGGRSFSTNAHQKRYYDAALRQYMHKHFSSFCAPLLSKFLSLYRFFFPYGL